RREPYRLWFEQRAWYALGHHETHGELRCLKLNRFAAVEPTEQPYAIPDDFTLDDYRGDAWRMIRGDRVYDVAIRFTP
ncbi:WYL domain-containing protein, partial [Halomonas sp. SIMBA_159]